MKRRDLLAGAPAVLVTARGWPVNDALAAEGGVYVAVGYGGRRMSSRDGVTWENLVEWAGSGGDDSNNLMSVAFGAGKFVAVGGGGWNRETQAGHILVSPDGATWTEVRKAPNRINPVLFGDGRFVAGGADRVLLWSDDGETWNRGGRINYDGPDWAFWFRSGAAGNGRFVFTGNCGAGQIKACWCAVSPDGRSIEHFTAAMPFIRAVAFGAGRFVVTGGDGLRMSSLDGRTWEHQVNEPGEDLRTVFWTGREFFTCGGNFVFTSPDGITWERRPQRTPVTPLWGDQRILVGTGWPGKMASSTDLGQRWVMGPPLPPNGINQVAYGTPSPGR